MIGEDLEVISGKHISDCNPLSCIEPCIGRTAACPAPPAVPDSCASLHAENHSPLTLFRVLTSCTSCMPTSLQVRKASGREGRPRASNRSAPIRPLSGLKTKSRTWKSRAGLELFSQRQEKCCAGCLPYATRLPPAGAVGTAGGLAMQEGSALSFVVM